MLRRGIALCVALGMALAGTAQADAPTSRGAGFGAWAFGDTAALNDPPIVDFTVTDSNPKQKQVVGFCPEGTSDPNSRNQTFTFEWDFDGDGAYDTTTAGLPSEGCTSHAYNADGPAKAGPKNATLRATASGGGSATKSHTVTVQTIPPTASLLEYDGTDHPTGQKVFFESGGSTDPDGEIVKREWDFDGDGSYEVVSTGATLLNHVYTDPGDVTVHLRVTDEDGETAVASAFVHVVAGAKASFKVGAPKKKIFTGDDVYLDGLASKSGSGFCDKCSTVVSWDLDGDGKFEKSTFAPAIHAKYAKAGPVTVSMRVEDLAHKSVATTSLPIEISNTAPVGKIKLVTGSYDPANDGPVFNTEGYQAITFVADGVKDPDGPPHTVTSYQWDFDGKKRGSAKPANTRTPAIGQIVPLPPGFEKQASGPWVVHKFIPRDKPYVVDLVLTDDSGGRTVIQKTVKAVKPVKATASFFVDQPQPYHMTDDGKTILRPGHKYKFNGASSSPSNASYFWSIYGNAFEEKSSVAYFDFPKVGSFTAKLRVETPAGKKNEIGLPIVVAPNKPPHAKIELVTEDPREGDVITFSAGQSSDPDSSLATFDPSFQPLIPAKFEWGHMDDNGGQDSPKFVPDPPNTTGDYFHDVKMSAGTHNMAVRVTDDEGASSVASLDIAVKPPACGSSYTGGGMQIDVDHPGDDAQNCLRVTKEGSCKQTNKTCNYVQIDGPFTFNGLHVDPKGQVAAIDYLGEKPVDPGNAPCGKAIGNVQPSVLQGEGAVSKGSFSLHKSQFFSWWLESDGTLGCVGYNPAAPNKFNGLDVAGISQPVSDGAGSYKWNFWIKLPAALGGTTSDAITSDTYFAEKRLRRSGASRRALAKSIPPLHVNAGSLAGGVLPLDDLTLDYDGADSFHISASAHLPAPADNIGEIAGGATVTGGSFVAGDLSLDVGGAGFPIGSTGVFLSKLNFGINLQNGTHFTGGARFDIGPDFVNGHSAVSLDSQVNLDFPAGGYWHVGASGNLSVIGIGPLANAGFDYASNGYVGVSGGVSYYPFKNVGFEAGISGAFLYPHFNIAGHGSGRVKWLKRGIDVNVSDIGLGACLEVSSFWHPGITVSYSPFDIDFFFHGCDLGDVTQVINPPPARQRLLLGGGLASNPLRARAAGTTDGFDVKGDQPGAIFTAFGQGGAPRITLTGPSGQTVTTPVSEDEPVENSRFLAGTDQETASSDVILKKPQKGHWTVKVESGPPVTSARFVAGLTSTGVQAKVKGSGFKRTLEYKVTAAKLQRVRFLEVGKGATRLIGTSKPGSSTGTIPFTPTVGPGGDRKIVAEVDTSGSPGSTDAVAHYTAPKPTPPPATAPKITRKGGALVVTWDASPTASSYDLVVTLGDGTKIERRLTAKQHSLTIPVTRAATASATATVTPFDAFGLRGGPATRQVHGTVAKAVSVKPTSYVQFVDPKTTRPVDIPPDQQVALP